MQGLICEMDFKFGPIKAIRDHPIEPDFPGALQLTKDNYQPLLILGTGTVNNWKHKFLWCC